MPQLSPLNWVILSVAILSLIFLTKMFFSFMTLSKLNFLGKKSKGLSSNLKWFW